MAAELSGKTQSLIIEILSANGPLTYADIAHIAKKPKGSIKSSMIRLRAAKMVRIAGYTLENVKRDAHIWGLGSQPDAKRPNFQGEHRAKKQREAQRDYYYRQKIKKIGPSPWAGLLP